MFLDAWVVSTSIGASPGRRRQKQNKASAERARAAPLRARVRLEQQRRDATNAPRKPSGGRRLTFRETKIANKLLYYVYIASVPKSSHQKSNLIFAFVPHPHSAGDFNAITIEPKAIEYFPHIPNQCI